MKTPACYLVAAFVVLPCLLVGQAGQSNRSLPSTPQGLLALLAGTWHFDLYAQGSDGPVASGQRDMRLLPDSMKLTWRETVVGRSEAGAGILGYNTATGAYYALGAVEHEPSPMILIGRADSSGYTVVFDVASTDNRLAKPGIYVTSELRLIDPDHFEWITLGGRGRGVFNRIGHS
jgi:hypothetical protein